MSWVILQPQDIKDRMTAQEIQAVDQTTSNPGGVDGVISAVIPHVTELVRSKVARNRDNRAGMGPSGTVPSELYEPALDVCRYKVACAAPDFKDLLATLRKDVYETAMELLKEAADGDIEVMGVNDTTYPSGQPQYGGQHRFRWFGHGHDGLPWFRW